jgi:AraC-like DNA-binding protein
VARRTARPPIAIDEAMCVAGSVRVGRFRRPPDHPEFRDSGPIQSDCCVAFPRSAVVIRHSGDRFVADPNVVSIYNRGQEYTREALTPAGDRSDWYGVSDAVVRDAVRLYDPRAADARRPLRWTHAPVSAHTYLQQRRLFNDVQRGRVDAMRVEETVLGILDRVLAAAYGRETRCTLSHAHRDLVTDAQCEVDRRLMSEVTLQEIASRLGVSVFHLCRTFRAVTGHTIHGYRRQLRVRAALERVEGASDLTAVALALGYCSHSHFAASFRRAFGVTPSGVRRVMR